MKNICILLGLCIVHIGCSDNLLETSNEAETDQTAAMLAPVSSKGGSGLLQAMGWTHEEGRQFEFQVFEKDREYHGSLTLNNHISDVKLRGKVTCMTKIPGAAGEIAVIIARETTDVGSTIGGFLPGVGSLLFAVRDGLPDQSTHLDALDPGLGAAICANPAAFGLDESVFDTYAIPFDKGDIWVR